ncbi:DUF397 domain-containing protein [Goodfellowiella coeruleoviolacea]|uniref:DUF397 domain-containing protein n=1 Tax=Goodfellowiella coeruleoviolacea TaxID=334858 RepID=A0AAE3KHR7_9PSEU|nr:DUF397 domain-containing protein [Goodfellowiella coeruleoviolacea]MCP2167167.1 protein of unknown function (DUF397) [Goodfellowiella coeruleoviolacea]
MNENRLWRKSSRTSAGANNCVELAVELSGMLVRDSKKPDGGTLTFGPAAFGSFMAAVKDGRLDTQR